MKYIDAATVAVALTIGYLGAVRVQTWNKNRKNKEMGMSKRVLAMVVAAVMVVVGGLTIAVSAAEAGEGQGEVCYAQINQVQLEKHTRERSREADNQHYSYTGGKRSVFDPPTWPGDDGDWQANTHQEPHHGADAGLHWTGQWWNASWFYFEQGWGEWTAWSEPVQANTHFEWVDADNVPEPNWQEHGGSYTDTYQRDWALLENGETGTRDGDRVPCEDQPPAEERTDETTDTDCETRIITTTTFNYETPYVLNDGYEWVLGEEVLVGEASSQRAATDEECPPTTEPPREYECDGDGDGLPDHDYNDPTDGVCAEEIVPETPAEPEPEPIETEEPVALVADPVQDDTLPVTGAGLVGWLTGAGVALIGGGAGTLRWVNKRR